MLWRVRLWEEDPYYSCFGLYNIMFVAYFFEIFQYIHIFLKNVLQCHLVCVSTTEFKNIRPSRFVALLSFVFLLPIPLTSGGQEVERILCTWWIVTQIWSSEWKCTKEKDSDVVLDMRSNRDLSNARKEEKKPQNMWKDFLGGTNKLYQMPDHTLDEQNTGLRCVDRWDFEA